MSDLGAAFLHAFQLIARLDPDLLEIIALTFQVSLAGLVAACLVALPLGAAIAIFPFRGRTVAIALLNMGLGLPAVVVGLVTYLLLSRSGPLAALGLLFTPTAMAIAQFLLITPLIAALVFQTIADMYQEYREQLQSFDCTRARVVITLLWEARLSLATAVLAGFGRALSEVGAVIIVGGNINHYTRVMTTTIQLETMKGNLALAMALGIVLLALTFLVTLSAQLVRNRAGLQR